jgi:hypothetical protein
MAGKAVDPKIFAQQQVTRLSVYAEGLKQQISSEKDVEKRLFFERDLKKTLSKIEKLK